jgi:fructose-1-phosphate kinase PfkB-like protein
LDSELAEFAAAFAEHARDAAVVVLSGSLPSNVPPTFYRELLNGVQGKAILDARGPELLAALERRPFVVKPNREELARTVGRSLDSTSDLLAAMHELNARGAAWVIVTQGAGPVWATSHSDAYRADPPRAPEVVNPIGCGDCLAAGLAAGLARGLSAVESLPLGMAAAAENLRTCLPARFDWHAAQELARSIAIQEKGPANRRP